MGNDVSVSRYNSLANGVNYINSNKNQYDKNCVDKISLEFKTYLSNINTYREITGERYVSLDKDQYKAFMRINKMISELKYKKKDDTNNAVVEGQTN